MKCRPCKQPNDNDEHSSAKGPGAAEQDGGTMCEHAKGVANDTKDVAFMLVLLQLFCLGLVHDAT
jgi:hypothetical protein